MRTRVPLSRPGFTMTEVLVVMAIIAVLAGLLLAAVQSALLTGQRAAVTMNLNQLENALNIYKNKYGDFPPSEGFDDNATNLNNLYRNLHFRKAFKMISPPATIIIDDRRDPNNPTTATLQFSQLDPAEALVFYLGGMPAWGQDAQEQDAVEMTGFSRQPLNPFDRTASQRTEVLVDFVQMGDLRDKDGDLWPEFYLDGAEAPVVYFKGGQYSARIDPSDPSSEIQTQFFATNQFQSWGMAAPYALRPKQDANDKGQWINADGVQLIHCGKDGVYDELNNALPLNQYRVLPLGANARKGEFDNQTNFADGILENYNP